MKDKLEKYGDVPLKVILNALSETAAKAVYIHLERRNSREDSSRFKRRMENETGLKSRRIIDLAKTKK